MVPPVPEGYAHASKSLPPLEPIEEPVSCCYSGHPPPAAMQWCRECLDVVGRRKSVFSRLNPFQFSVCCFHLKHKNVVSCCYSGHPPAAAMQWCRECLDVVGRRKTWDVRSLHQTQLTRSLNLLELIGIDPSSVDKTTSWRVQAKTRSFKRCSAEQDHKELCHTICLLACLFAKIHQLQKEYLRGGFRPRLTVSNSSLPNRNTKILFYS
ncbi:hypothetical protein EGW08_003101 [Elysia chlorotica]|uniref:Uncharacterized protein n=1 Tax=Elysia chlorotica TaxID=188477 RepID=A0A3S0ZYF8_ELYCH|nr:hypothetical protein EGW08_003101 [Elysia chlorotica]